MKVLVFDVGGSSIKYALMDHNCEFYEKGQVPTPMDTKEHFLDAIEAIYSSIHEEVNGLAFSLPGNIDVNKGDIYTPGALLYNANTNFFETIASRIDLPVSVENDGKCAALAELWKGNLKDCQNGAVFILGTGIGGGLICDRKLLKGTHFFAGELSFILEGSSASFHACFAMQGSASALCEKVAAAKGLQRGSVNGIQVFDWIKQQDACAIKAMEEVAAHIALHIFNTQCYIDPEIVCIGGGISKQPILIQTIQEQLEKIYESFPIPVPKTVVMPCKYHNDSNLIGALYHYQLQFGDEKYE